MITINNADDFFMYVRIKLARFVAIFFIISTQRTI
jgi:hypothetical protein